MKRIVTDPWIEQHQAGSDALVFDNPHERLDFYRREIHHESGILSGRTNSYLSAQSFLVIVYASSMANTNEAWGDLFTLIIPLLLAALGIGSSLHAWPGIKASVEVIMHWYFKQDQLLRSKPDFGRAYDDSPLFCQTETSEELHYRSLMFSLRSPWIFTTVWVALGSLSTWLQLPSTNV